MSGKRPIVCRMGMRKRRRFVRDPNRVKWGQRVTVGMQGFLITCSGSANTLEEEACGLLAEYTVRLYGPEKNYKKDDKPTGSEEQEEEDDEEEAAQSDVDQKDLRRFEVVETNSSSRLFIRSFNVEPEKLIHYMMTDMSTTRQERELSLQRIIPFSGSCRATLEDLRKYAEIFFQPWFKAPKKGSFCIEYKQTHCNTISREKAVYNITDALKSLNCVNRFDQYNPDYTIAVELIYNVCFLGVLKDYNLFKRYNLQQAMKRGGME